MSGKNHEGNKSPDIYDGNDQRRFLCSRAMKHEVIRPMKCRDLLVKGAKREGHRNVQGQIRLSLGATLERGEGHECPLADRAVVGSNIQTRGVATAGNIQRKDMNAHWQIGLVLGTTFKRGEDT
jgi:hypothetical protein